MIESSYKIRGMDCAEEVAVLKRSIGPMVDDETCLKFDLINGKMTVEHEGLTNNEIVSKVARTGMEAIPWEEHIGQN